MTSYTGAIMRPIDRLLVVAALVAGVSSLLVERDQITPALSVGGVLLAIADAMIGAPGPYTFEGPLFARFFPVALQTLGIAGLAASLVLLFRPLTALAPHTRDDWARAERLIREHGDDTLAAFALRDDKSFFFASDGEAMIAFTYVLGYALASGDPIGAPAVGLCAEGHGIAERAQPDVVSPGQQHVVGAQVAVRPSLFVQSTHRVAGIREQSERGTAVGGRVGQRRGQGRPTGVEDDELGDVRAVDDLDQAHHTMAAEGPQHLGLSTQSGALSAPSGLPQHRLVADPVAGQGHPRAGGAVVVESVQGVGLQRLEVVHHVSSRVSPAGGPAGGWGRTGCCRPGRERRGGRCAGSRSAWWRPPWSR